MSHSLLKYKARKQQFKTRLVAQTVILLNELSCLTDKKTFAYLAHWDRLWKQELYKFANWLNYWLINQPEMIDRKCQLKQSIKDVAARSFFRARMTFGQSLVAINGDSLRDEIGPRTACGQIDIRLSGVRVNGAYYCFHRNGWWLP